ncbi:MAG: 2-phosphosulfolactate phosphatase [Bdellovibrionales bacterium]
MLHNSLVQRDVSVVLVPSSGREAALGGRTAIVIDVFRATTTILAALSQGAMCIKPVTSREEALALRRSGQVSLAGGESDAIKMEGFDAGNSPLEYTQERVRNASVAFVTTNGTKAILFAAGGASQVLLGCMNNRRAVAAKAAATGRSVTIVCSGRKGNFSLDDTLCAGLIAQVLCEDFGYAPIEDSCHAALALCSNGEGEVMKLVREGRSFQRLTELKMQKDLDFALRLDTNEGVPFYDPRAREVRLAEKG